MLCLLLPQPETKIYNQDLSVKRMSVYVLAPSEGQLGCGSPISSGWMYGSKSMMGPLSLLCVCVCVCEPKPQHLQLNNLENIYLFPLQLSALRYQGIVWDSVDKIM